MSNVVLQDNFDQYVGDAYAGMIHDPMDLDIITRINVGVAGDTEAEARIPFGRGVWRAASNMESGCSRGGESSATLETFMGVAIRTVAVPEKSQSGNATPTYDLLEEVGILESGRIWVYAEEAVIAGDPVFVTSETTGGSDVGGFSKGTPVGSDTLVQLKSCQWESTAAAGSLGIMNMTGLNAFFT